MTQIITSRDNDTVKYACKIGQSKAFRQSEGCFLAEGLKLCLELARALLPLKVFYTTEALERAPQLANLQGEHFEIQPHVADKLAQTQSTQGVFVLFETPIMGLEQLRPAGRYLVLEQMQDPSNVGAMLRSAAAFGFHGAVLLTGTADVFCNKALRASMGAVGQIQILQEVSLEEAVTAFATANIPLVAAALEGAMPLDTIEPPKEGVALLIGNEGSGLTRKAVEAAQFAVRIPMTEQVESLNAAAAATVLLWHFRAV